MRTPTRRVELHGQVIPGANRLAVIGSANHDRESSVSRPFRLVRQPNPHLAFGYGIHFCLGAALSRMEARIALTDLLQLSRASNDPIATRGSREASHVHGPAKLPVQFVAAVSGPITLTRRIGEANAASGWRVLPIESAERSPPGRRTDV